MRNLLFLRPPDPDIGTMLSLPDWQVHQAEDPAGARALLATHSFRVGLVCLSCRDRGIPSWFEGLIRGRPAMKWVALTDRRCLESEAICALIRERFHDYHTSPLDPARLVVSLGHAHGMAELAGRVSTARTQPSIHYGMVGSSPVMQALFSQLEKAAEVSASVLITGETGTGKELIARAIHDHSARRAGPCLAVNCGALPASLAHSELFGYEQGAFTDARKRKIGLIESASGGTLFLDEIGDLPLDLQVILLRFHQENYIQRLGGLEPIPLDIRVIAATNIDLEQAIRQGRFREDLFYRLEVLRIRSPSLRERDGDIEELAEFFLAQFSRDARGPAIGFSQQALGCMRGYAWPGNVRELMNRVRRAVLLSENPYIEPSDLGLERRSVRRNLTTLRDARIAAETEAIRSSLCRTRNNVSQAAEQLGVSRVTLYRLMARYDLE